MAGLEEKIMHMQRSLKQPASDSACAEKVTALALVGTIACSSGQAGLFVDLLVNWPTTGWEGSCQARQAGGQVYLWIPFNERMHSWILILEKGQHCLALVRVQLTYIDWMSGWDPNYMSIVKANLRRRPICSVLFPASPFTQTIHIILLCILLSITLLNKGIGNKNVTIQNDTGQQSQFTILAMFPCYHTSSGHSSVSAL